MSTAGTGFCSAAERTADCVFVVDERHTHTHTHIYIYIYIYIYDDDELMSSDVI